MAKKIFDKLNSTVERQDQVLRDRYDNADSILLKSSAPASDSAPAPQKSSVVRDTFSMPPDDYALIEALRTTAALEGRISTSKSEIVRAGLRALHRLDGMELTKVLGQLTKVPPGRKR